MKNAAAKSRTTATHGDTTQEALKRCGVTRARVAKRLSEELDAVEVKVVHEKGGFEKCDDGEYRYHEGQFSYSEPMPAHQARLKAIELSIALLRMKPAEKVDVNHSGKVDTGEATLLTDLERATRLVYLLEQAAKQEAEHAKGDGRT